uniref:Pancreatic trypsin inhibitor n=1 Tax=Rhipicephalus zambeziensis TaxID=60191 RepID=A0A224YCS9_9ACAR
MASSNIHTVRALFFVFLASEASGIKGLGAGGQTEIPGISSIQATKPPEDESNPAFPKVTSSNPTLFRTGVGIPSIENDHSPSEPEGAPPLEATSPKEETPGLTASLPLAGIPGYDERCNMQATTTKTKCKSNKGGKKRRRGWYLEPTSRKCLPSCDENAPFRYKIHCNAICRTERACHFSATSFPCGFRTMHPVYTYDRTQKRCVKAHDCDYYGNKFVTLKECRKTCVKGTLQQTQQQVTSTTRISHEPSNQVPHFLPPTNGLPVPSLPGAPIGQFITGNQVAAGGTQQTSGSPAAGSLTSLQTATSSATQSQQPAQTPTPVLPGPGIQVPPVVPGSVLQQSANAAGTSSQVSTQTQNSASNTLHRPPQLPSGTAPIPGLHGNQISTEKPLSIGPTSIPQTTSQDASSGSPLRPGQVPSGSGITVSPELEIVAAGTGPRRNQVTTESSPSDTSGESLSLDLGLGGLRGPLNTGATSVSGNLRRTSSGFPTSFGPLPQQFGASVSPELEIVAVRTGRMPRPPSGRRSNRPRTGTSRPGISRKPGSAGLGGAPPRVSLTSARGPTIASGTNAQMPGSTVILGIHHPGLSLSGPSRPQIIGPARIPGITTGANASQPSNVPDNLDLGLGTVEVSSHTGSTSSSINNTQISGLTKSTLTVKHGKPSGGVPALPPVPETSKQGPVKIGTSGYQAPSLPMNPVAPVLQKPRMPATPPLNQNLLPTRPTTPMIGPIKEAPVMTGTSSLQAPSLPVNPAAPVLQKPSFPPTPPKIQNLLQQRPTTQKGGTSKEGVVKTGTTGLEAPSPPVIPVGAVLQKPSFPPTPPPNQNVLQQRPTTEKGGTSKEGVVKTGVSGPEAPTPPVIPVGAVLPKPSLPPSPSLNQNRIHKRPTTQKNRVADHRRPQGH